MSIHLNILSFNILAPCWASPQWYPDGLDADLLDRNYRRKRIIDVISASKADIVCLQEVTDVEFKAIKSALPYFKGFMSHNDPSYWSEWIVPELPWEPNGCAILARTSKFTSLNFKDYALSDTGNHAARLSAVIDGVNISIWSIHLDSDKAQNRKLELESLMTRIGDGIEIIAGDFNIDGDSSNLRRSLQQAKFVDALKSVGNFEATHPFSNTYYQSHVYAVIDHILTRGARSVFGDVLDYGLWSIKNETKRVEATLEKAGSDHFTVISTLLI